MTAFPTDAYACNECGNTYDSAEELAIHKRRTGHDAAEAEGFPCLECGERFNDAAEYREHLRLAHTQRR
jgi:hypothetical protein